MDESSIISSLHKENIVPNLSLLSETLKSSLPSSVKPKRAQWYSPCNSPRPKQPNSPDDYLPILKLTHFEKTPRILFNSVKLGSSKTEELVVWNPNPVAQAIRVEKCPTKHGFSVELLEYRGNDLGSSVLTIEADEEIVLPIRWEPKDAGKYREMIVFKWNETHRLQTIVIGTAVDLKTKKKRSSVLGLSHVLNTKPVTKPFKPPKLSVVAKQVKAIQENITENHEFDETLPEVKEDVIEENIDERRETYVVKTPVNITGLMNKKPQDLILGSQVVVENKAGIEKEYNKMGRNEKLQSEKTNIDAKKTRNSKECKENSVKDPQGAVKNRAKFAKGSMGIQPFKVDNKVDNKIGDKTKQMLTAKPKISVPAVDIGKKKLTSGPRKERKVLPSPVAFSVEPTIKKPMPKPVVRNHQRKSSSQMPNGSSPLKKTRKVKLKVAAQGVAPTKLKLARPPKTSIPRHPMPFAAKNMYYDERWIDKQEEGFTRWLNFVLTPPDDCEMSKSNNKKDLSTMLLTATKSRDSSQPKAPSKEELSLKAYTARRKMSRLRRLACLLYQSEPVICILRKIEAEVEGGRIAIRPDKKMYADLGIKNNVVRMILSYNPLWLRIGLETTFGEIMPIQTNSDIHGLARFVSDRLLGNPDIARTYAHPKVPGLYREGYVEQLAKFTLKKFLFLVLFLDRAKLTRLIDHDPCLFVKEAEFKSSRSILLAFSRDYLKGEGDITKHLSYLGFSVSHEQRPIDEFNYAVTNIAIDLRDGLRLTRVVELLTQNWQLTQNLRVPAISRLQKIHNVEVFMKALREHNIPVGEGTDSGINPRHVVDGHREKTLQLLWLIIFNFQVNILLNEKQLREEISFLEQNQDLQNCLETMTVDGSKIIGLPRSKRESLENNVYFKSPRLSLLLKWCRHVCKLYGMKVENFTVSFSDGRALCYLLHYYHPHLLPLDMINQETTLTRNPGVQDNSDSEQDEGIITDSWASCFSPGSGRNLEIERLKAKERENFKLLAEKVQALGGVPLMAKFSDMSNTIPDEKVVITYTSYLCARLLDLREETRAARTIQVAWRKYLLRKQLERRKNLSNAAVLVQAYARGAMVRRKFLKLRKAAIVIQSAYRGQRARLQITLKHQAARQIQAKFRATRNMCHEREEFLRYRKAVVSMQTLLRGKQCREMVKKIRAAVKIQAMWRCYKERGRYLETRKAVILCQRLKRGTRQRKNFLRLKTATVMIQSHVRANIARNEERKKYELTRNVVITIQAFYRGHQARLQVKKTLAAIIIQKYFRMTKQRSVYMKQREAVMKIQAMVRKYLAQRNYIRLKTATCLIQNRYRAYRVGREQRKKHQMMKSCCVKIQALQRGYLMRKRFLMLKNSTIKIQAAIRKVIAQSQYQKIRRSAIVIQKYYRSYLLMKQAHEDYKRQKTAVITIQAFYRSYKCRASFLKTKMAASKIQACFRGYQERKHFLQLKNSSIVLQRRYLAVRKGRQERLMYHIKKRAMITIQAAVRGFLVKQSIKHQHVAATTIQATYRSYAQKSRYNEMKKACEVLQMRYRAAREGRVERVRYQKIRGAVIVIQAAFRGKAVRKEIIRQNKTAVIIQAAYRRYAQRSKFLTTRKASITIQCWYRAIQLRRIDEERYKTTRAAVLTLQAVVRGLQARKFYQRLKAVVCLQSAVRGCLVRRELKRMNNAALCLQTCYRGFVAQKKYRAVRESVLTIQAYYKAFVLGKHDANRYQAMRKAAIKIQSVYRGYLARNKYSSTRKAIICIQAGARGFLAARYYRKLRQVTISMQQRHRANLLLLKEYMWYHIQRGACIVIQTAVRRHVARTRFLAIKTAAITIQRRYRAVTSGRQQRDEYKRIKAATLTIQSFTRGMVARKNVREYRAARTIQALYRMYTVRKSYQEYRHTVIKIQALVRMARQRHRYKALKAAALTVQLRYRAVLLGTAVRRNYTMLQSATIVIQKMYRGFKARKVVEIIRAAVKIQATYKAYIARKEFLKIKRSVLIIQSNLRTMIAVRQFQETRQAVVVLQRRFRAQKSMEKERMEYITIKKSVILIQAMVRGRQSRNWYLSLRKATTYLQRKYRATVAATEKRKKFLRLRISAIVVQSAFRGLKARQLSIQMRAARTIQSFYKMHVLRKDFLVTRKAVVKIQAYVRMRNARREFANIKSAALTCQTLFRANKQCREQRRYFTSLRESVILVQSLQRGIMARKRMKKMVQEKKDAINAAITIQKYYRGYLEMRYLYFRFHYIRGAIITIQSVYRGHVTRNYTSRVKAARKIQSYYRGFVARKSYHGARKSIISVQAMVRCHQARVKYLKIQNAVIACQQQCRATRNMREELRRYQKTKEAIISIQAAWRGHARRKQYVKTLESIVKIQGVAKMYIARTEFKRMKEAALVLQCRYRALCLGRVVRRDYVHVNNTALTIQSFYRGYQARKYARQIYSARIIQRRFRAVCEGKAVRGEFVLIKKSAVIIQAAYRGYQGRRKARLHQAARLIQSNIRGYIARKQVKQLKEDQQRRLTRFSAAVHHHLSAIRIQRAYRQARAIALAKKQMDSVLYIQCWWRATLLHRRFLAMREAAIVLQRTARRNLDLKHRAATRIQAFARVWLARRTVTKMNIAALRIQALWRGYQVRRRVKSLKIKAARRRIRAANNAATESMKLCNRTRSALDYLLRCKNLTTIFDVLVNLEVVTRLSYVCCEQLLTNKALRVIFTVIRSSNRSVPYMEILKYALAILINLAKCPTTYRAVYEEQDSIITLLELITIFREKEQIFSRACCLLTILARRDGDILQEMLNTPKMTEKIKSAHYLITRKCNLVKRRSVVKAKMAQSTPYKNAPPSTPCGQTPFKSRTPFKSHTPFKGRKVSEWAMWQEYVNKVKDPLQAVRSLMRVLHLDYETNVN